MEEVGAVPHATQGQVAAAGHWRKSEVWVAHLKTVQQVLQHGKLVEFHEAVAQVAVQLVHVAGMGPE